MADPGRTVRVSGLPTDMEDDRLRDKLFIHFLRARNGGGEINCVTVVKTTPVSALITFEDSGVAQRVIEHSRHTLEVDGKKYKLTVTEHRERLDPDMVILCLSATVDHSQLPGGMMALTSLHKSHPHIQISFDAAEDLCTLHGAYSKVQAALGQLFGQPGRPRSAENFSNVQMAQKPQTHDSEDQSRKHSKHREQREKGFIEGPDELNSSSRRALTPGGYGWEDTGQSEGLALQQPQHPAMPEEDFSLIVDADMFQYLQKHCQEEYQHILSQYVVDVVDMTNQGLTTLFLQVATGGGDSAQHQQHLNLAKKAITRLYQENETKIRRDHFPKSILHLRGGQQRMMESLSARFPKLLLNEDDWNIYIIGSSSDVSEAKQFLLLDSSEVRGEKEDVASQPLYDSGASTHADEQRVPLILASSPDQLLRSEEDERQAEGARRYKLAARFKDSGLELSRRPADFTLRGLLSPSRQTRPGPVLGHDVLSGRAGPADDGVFRALAQNDGGDVLFKSGDALPSITSMQNKTSSNSHFIDTQPKSLTPLLSTTQSSLSESTLLPPAESGSTLRRTTSFSGVQKVQVTSQKSQDDSGKSTDRARGRSSSFSNQTGRQKQEVYNADMTVSIVMWKHIKEAYRTRVDDLTSDIQMKESSSDVRGDLIITLRGANSSKVRSCLKGLQKLVDSVSVDFSVQELHLSELGITDPADETLQACCAEVRSRFKKVTMQIIKKRLFLSGPEVLCSQVAASLREVFSGDSTPIPKQQGYSGNSSSSRNPLSFLQMNEDQSINLYGHSNPQVMLKCQTSKAGGPDCRQERRTNQGESCDRELMNGSISQPLVRKNPVVKDKVKIVGTVDLDGQQMETFVRHSETGNDASHVNDDGLTTGLTDGGMARDKKERTVHDSALKDACSMQQRQTEIQDTPEESTPCLGVCVCGVSGTTRTKCGATMCSECLDTVHVHCRVCLEPTICGIRGKMSYSKLHISLPGRKNASVIKITYSIPDGIQGEDHPSPGEPFQGGLFEAFLPDSERTRKLVPRLEKAFREGLTFTVTGKDTGAMVTWHCIPHKTSLQGGESGNGYADSTYLTLLSEVLTSKGIEEPPVKS